MNRHALAVGLSAFLLPTFIAAASPQDRTVADVRQMAADARKAIDAYKASNGARDAADHPAIKRSDAIWEVHDRAPSSDAGAIAAFEAIRLLNRAELWDRAQARVASLGADDPAWERVPTALYEASIERKRFDETVATLSRTATSTTRPANKAAALIVIGRVHRRLGDLPAAARSMSEARAAAPGTPQAEEAGGLIYEIEHLSIGRPAPAVSGTPRNARRAITLDAFRGKPIVLVFWATTCHYCMEDVPLLKTLHDKYAKEAVFLGVSVDVSVDRVDRTIKEKGLNWPQLADGKGFEGPIPASYRIQGTPELFVLDRAGRIFAKPATAALIEAQIKEALARPPQP